MAAINPPRVWDGGKYQGGKDHLLPGSGTIVFLGKRYSTWDEVALVLTDMVNGRFASRGDAVATWIKRERDLYDHGSEHWSAIDRLLDEYRLHADTGTPLAERARDGGDPPETP